MSSYRRRDLKRVFPFPVKKKSEAEEQRSAAEPSAVPEREHAHHRSRHPQSHHRHAPMENNVRLFIGLLIFVGVFFVYVFTMDNPLADFFAHIFL